MTGLILFLLFIIAVVYGVFFLFFKVIWILFKKSKNTWPLILAGISTVLSGLLLVGLTAWSISLVVKPFLPLKQRVETNPQPIYGLQTYVDPAGQFSLQLPNGMDYAEWISFQRADIKLGIDTNLFKKDEAGQAIKTPLVFSMIIRQTKNIDPENPFEKLNKELNSASKNKQIEFKQFHPIELDGRPGYYAQGIAYSDRGTVPMWLQAVYVPDAIIYVFAFEVNQGADSSTALAQQLVTSLKPTSAPAVQ